MQGCIKIKNDVLKNQLAILFIFNFLFNLWNLCNTNVLKYRQYSQVFNLNADTLLITMSWSSPKQCLTNSMNVTETHHKHS